MKNIIFGVSITALLLSRFVTSAWADSKPKIITFDGYGPIKFGMTLKAAEKSGINLIIPEVQEYDCLDGISAKGFPDLNIHINPEDRSEHTVIGSFSVLSRNYMTAEGARLGDSVQKIKKAYAGRMEIKNERLQLGPREALDKNRTSDKGYVIDIYSPNGDKLIRFHTDGEKIDGFYVGRRYDVLMIGNCN